MDKIDCTRPRDAVELMMITSSAQVAPAMAVARVGAHPVVPIS
jgi:hypothetical protein